ncbi:MAG: HemY domain protein [Pseudomonadota bacterium]|jgi:HemY protein
MMRRSLVLFLKLSLLVLAAVWIAERPGRVEVEWQGYLIETTTGVLALAALVLVVLSALAYRGWRALLTSPRAFGRYRLQSKRERGYRALTQGMVAVAAGDAEAAERFARKADVLLNEPPLTLLLSAQAAQLNGDDQAARKYFQAMLDRPETAFLGLRGLLTQALRTGNRKEALSLARRAQALQPKSQWPAQALVELEAQSGNWKEAEIALDKATRIKALAPDRAKRDRTAVLVEESRQSLAAGQVEQALTFGQKAHDLCPGSVPAAVQLARVLLAAGKGKKAAQVVETAWRLGPHPDLAAIWGDTAGSDDPLARVKHYQALLALDPSAAEGHVAVATASLRATLWGQARSHLLKARDIAPTARIWRLLAEVERAEHGDGPAVREMEAKQAGAEPDGAWTCTACGTPAPEWTAVCGRCGGFDTLDWQQHGSAKAPVAALKPPAP